MLLLGIGGVLAWNPSGLTWEHDRFPLRWCAEGESETVSAEDFAAAASFGVDQWEDVDACPGARFEQVEDCSDADVVFVLDPTTTGLGEDYDTPDDEHFERAQLTLGDGDWVLLGDDCVDGLYLESALVHGAGHALGLAHSCEQGEVCSTASEMEAAMFWSSGVCAEVVPNEDDADGIAALYGRYGIEWELTQDGESLFCWELVGEPRDGLEVSWSFGGEASSDWSPCHEFEVAGAHRVDAEVRDPEANCEPDGPEGTWNISIPLGESEDEAQGSSCRCASASPGGAAGLALGLLVVLIRRSTR